MLGDKTRMVFELWLQATTVEFFDLPERATVRKHMTACLDFLCRSSSIHGYAFGEDAKSAEGVCGDVQLASHCKLTQMIHESREEEGRLASDGDVIGEIIMRVSYGFSSWLYDGWLANGRDPSFKAIIKYLVGRI